MRHFARRPVCRVLGTIVGMLLPLATVVARADEPPPSARTLAADQVSALDRISADSLRGHLSFLASDLLEGRGTPSRGLDLAAEYIASQFRRAGLEPVGDDGYFQTAHWALAEPDVATFRFEIKVEGQASIRVGKEHLSTLRFTPVDVKNAGAFKVVATNADALTALTVEQVEGKAVLAEVPGAGRNDQASYLKTTAFQSRMTALKAALVIDVSHPYDPAKGFVPGRMLDPENPKTAETARRDRPGPPLFIVHDAEVTKLFDAAHAGPLPSTTVSLHQGEPVPKPIKVRNVVGLLRGSDPMLKDTYVLVTAHYDHLGDHGPGEGDLIFNGANDDGSGTVSVVELAQAIATLKPRPKRSILFMTFFGEEHGLLGSRYYGRHPIVPIEKTVADVNLEQVGRTDDSEGPRVGAAVMTGHGYSELTDIFTAAGQAESVRIEKHPRFSDLFFARSDNQALADLGVPAHTLGVAFMFPDYHGAGDHWDKIDYANMAKIDRMVARGLLMIANDPTEPKWSESNPNAARYLKAWKQRREAPAGGRD